MAQGIRGVLAGVVKSSFNYAKGTALVVEVLRGGRKYPETVTVWGVEDVFVPGNQVQFEGDVWGTAKEKNGKVFCDMSLNNPRLLSNDGHVPAFVPDEGPTDDGAWPSDAPVF